MNVNNLYIPPSQRLIRLYALLSLMTIAILTCTEAKSSDDTAEASVIFPTGKWDIDSCLNQNARSLDSIRRFVNTSDSNTVITRIDIYGHASPDGSLHLNRILAHNRTLAMKNFIIAEASQYDVNDIYLHSEVFGTDALCHEIMRSDINDRHAAIDILSDSVLDPALRLRRLKSAQNGRLWHEIKPLLGNLRCVKVVFSFDRTTPVIQSSDSPAEINETDTVTEADIIEPTAETTLTVSDTVHVSEPIPASGPITSKSSKAPLYLSLKTNMLYDAMLIPSVGAEAYIGKMWSVSANWSYAWWSKNSSHNFWRFYGGDIELRRWFGHHAAAKPLTGHHIGLYAQILTYDFELGGKGYMGNKYNYGGGLEYGFSLPVARRINIDFTLGVGYLGGQYYEYTPIDGHYVWQATKQRHWFGPTKAEVSLVWLIGRGNSNRQKGGDQ